MNKSDFSPPPYTWCIRGQGFHSAEDEDLLLNPEFLEKDAVTDSLRLRCAVSHKDAALEVRELRENVKTYRSEFQKRVIGTLSSSVARNERLFFCKQYLIQYIKRNMDAANWNAYMLLALICDRESLCSLDYQHYLANHDKYSQAHKAQRNSEKSSQFPFALKAGISEDANAYMPVEEYDHLLKVLYDGASQIAQKSGGAKNLFDVLIEFRSFITDVSQDELASFSSYKAAIDSLLCEITVPDGYTLSLCENDAKKFVLFIFSNYISAFQEGKSIDAAAGHFSRGFRVWQYRSFEEDKALYDYAVSLFELSSVWYTQAKNIRPADIARSRFSSDGYCISAEYEESECCEKAKVIQAAAQSYVCQLRNRHVDVSIAYVKGMLEECHIDQVPLLAVCIFSMHWMKKFTSIHAITIEDIESTLASFRPIKSKKTYPAQRANAIRFLRCIMDTLHIEGENCRRTWDDFVAAFGCNILSEEEAEAWRDVLRTRCIGQTDLPLIRLQLLIRGAINTCLPVQEESLYCYELGSPLQKGWYAKFLKEHPDIVDHVSKRIMQNRKAWEQTLSTYSKAWSSSTIDREKVKALCKDGSPEIRWGTSEQYLADFCRLHTRSADKANVMLQDLKSLLRETAMRKVLNDKALGVLKEATEDMFKNHFGFKIKF